MEQQTGSKLGERVHQGCILSLCLLNFDADINVKCWAGWSTSSNQGWWERYKIISDMQWYHPYGRKRRGTEEPLDESERVDLKNSEKVGLKLNIQKMEIMASSPITLWQIDGETMKTVTDQWFLGSRITADGDCSHEIKRCLLLGRKAMTNLDSVLKSKALLCWQRSV